MGNYYDVVRREGAVTEELPQEVMGTVREGIEMNFYFFY